MSPPRLKPSFAKKGKKEAGLRWGQSKIKDKKLETEISGNFR
jgi:hypothetical protein